MPRINERKIVQICPVFKEVFAVYDNEDGSFHAGPILFATLYDDGLFEMVDGCSDGIFEDPLAASNFSHFHYGPKSEIKFTPKDKMK